MTTSSLATELARTQDPLGPNWYARLRDLGIPDRVIFGVRPLIGVGHIVTHSTGLFEFHEDGDLALIIAEGEPEVPGWTEIHDLLAFMPEEPGRWWLRRGAVDLLGAYNITPWKLSPTTIHETPVSWLQAGADGVCIIDWTRSPADVLLGAGELRTESHSLKAKLERRIVEVALGSFQVTVALPNDGSEVRHAA